MPFVKGDPNCNRNGRPKGSVSMKTSFKQFLSVKVREIKGMPKIYNGIDISEWTLADYISAQQIFITIDKSTKKELKFHSTKFLTEVTDGIKHVIETEEKEENPMSKKLENLPLEKLLEIEKIIDSENNIIEQKIDESKNINNENLREEQTGNVNQESEEISVENIDLNSSQQTSITENTDQNIN